MQRRVATQWLLCLARVLLSAASVDVAKPPHIMSAISVGTSESFSATSIAGLEASILAHMDSVLMDEVGGDAAAEMKAEHLGHVSRGLESMIQKNISRKVTDKFLHHMQQSIDAYQAIIPNSASASKSNLDRLEKNIHKCEAVLASDLAGAEFHGDKTPDKKEVHENCRKAEAQAVKALEDCTKETAELKKFEGEDAQCAEWPALKAMTPQVAETCPGPKDGESYEEYLERARSRLDSQLLLYRELKNACAGRDAEPAGCDSEKITAQQRKELCDTQQAHLVRSAWNRYLSCYGTTTSVYKQEAKSFLASQQIECLLEGFTSPTPQTVLKECQEKRTKSETPKVFKLDVSCPPELKTPPKELPNHPGSGDFRKETYENLPSTSSVAKAVVACPIPPQTPVPKVPQMDCQKPKN
eukprot:TRINITY_DN59109_c0_g1_i1.p1 TRINITY_DN59109_c0_g1~~TRINITY_DN59109_c0_g1_i1.p1  ORF type:complete len:413 (-),score=90.03 TRINITY_DN59109_c0_g1_i1:37-1275(-)